MDTSDFDELAEQVEELCASLQEYQDLLAPLFDRYHGQTIAMRMPDGRVEQKQVSRPKMSLKSSSHP